MFEYYGTGGNALDPSELPEAPESGWTIELGTGPHCKFCYDLLQQCRS
jgi:hypothetical protein